MSNQNNKKGGLLGTLILIIIILLIWGVIGANQSKAADVTCDIGFGEKLCWKWHISSLDEAKGMLQDASGEIKDAFDQSGDAI